MKKAFLEIIRFEEIDIITASTDPIQTYMHYWG